MLKPLISSAPAHSILNAQAFRYTSSVDTDVRRTFERVRRARARPGSAMAPGARQVGLNGDDSLTMSVTRARTLDPENVVSTASTS